MLNFGIQAKSASARKALHYQRKINNITKTLDQIQDRYSQSFALLNQPDQDLVSNTLVAQAKQDYWFFRFTRSTSTIQNYIAKLEAFRANPVFNQNQNLNSLLSEINQTISQLQQLAACLTSTPEYVQDLAKNKKLYHFGLFIAYPLSMIIGYPLVAVGYCFILGGLFAASTPALIIGVCCCALSLPIFLTGIKCADLRRKDRVSRRITNKFKTHAA